ncbi:MAG TPA: substrate-binding domain-containing protein [Sphaerochaeta sp.]|nr:substrate-binding domain-containing protein [Sphaerochaeta sp.]
MKMKSKLFLVLLLVPMLAFVSCSGKEATPTAAQAAEPVVVESTLKIGMSFQELDNLYFVVMREALEEACKSMNAQAVVTDARHDVSKQISDIEDMIQDGIDILLINPTDSVGVQGAVETAKKAGVVVVAVDAQANGPIDSFVGSKNYDAGYMAGEYLAKQINNSGKVAILDGIPVVPILQRVEGFTDAMKNYPNIQIVDKQNGKQERSIALDVTENMIQANPDLSGIFSVNDGGSMGALAAIEGSGKNILLVSVDGNPEAVAAIQTGGPFKATSAQFPRDQVRIAIGIAMAKYWGANVPKHIPVDVVLLDKANSANFSW